MNLEPIHVLMICAGVALPLFALLIWRAVSRIFSAKVSMWEKVIGIAGLVVGVLIGAVNWPLIGGVVATLGLIVLLAPAGGGAAAGAATGGFGGGGGCSGGAGGGGC